ncbi:3-dehydroquinate dehydratase [Alphaproteobacteria bacterium]|nr:3-dehydroquinate dehydratase [Alphaproteobacteria bacterium]
MANPLIYLLLGPNHNMLGNREPDLYGTQTIGDVEKFCTDEATRMGLDIVFRQSSHEGDLLDWIHEANGVAIGVVLNASALARTSLVLQSTVNAVSVPVIEVHVTNIFRRDDRPDSLLTQVASGLITGFGMDTYRLGMMAVCRLTGVSSD